VLSSTSTAGYVLVKRKDIPALLGDEFHLSCWNQWCRWKRFGLPHGADGYMRERALWVACMEILEQEHAVFLKAQREKSNH
jgi:hypothetical protein